MQIKRLSGLHHYFRNFGFSRYRSRHSHLANEQELVKTMEDFPIWLKINYLRRNRIYRFILRLGRCSFIAQSVKLPFFIPESSPLRPKASHQL